MMVFSTIPPCCLTFGWMQKQLLTINMKDISFCKTAFSQYSMQSSGNFVQCRESSQVRIKFHLFSNLLPEKAKKKIVWIFSWIFEDIVWRRRKTTSCVQAPYIKKDKVKNLTCKRIIPTTITILLLFASLVVTNKKKPAGLGISCCIACFSNCCSFFLLVSSPVKLPYCMCT